LGFWFDDKSEGRCGENWTPIEVRSRGYGPRLGAICSPAEPLGAQNKKSKQALRQPVHHVYAAHMYNTIRLWQEDIGTAVYSFRKKSTCLYQCILHLPPSISYYWSIRLLSSETCWSAANQRLDHYEPTRYTHVRFRI